MDTFRALWYSIHRSFIRSMWSTCSTSASLIFVHTQHVVHLQHTTTTQASQQLVCVQVRLVLKLGAD